MTHELKTWPVYFDAILAGVKTFEVRKNDRPFMESDYLLLREWNELSQIYTGREKVMFVTYVLGGFVPGYTVMAIIPAVNPMDGCAGAVTP